MTLRQDGLKGFLRLLSVLAVLLPLWVSSFSAAQTEDEHGAILNELAPADVVYLAEEHANAKDHLAQLRIIRQLHGRNPDMAIGLEMVQRPFQEVLDRYIAGEVSEAELRQRTEYDTRWGYDWGYYAPIFRLAKLYQLPLIALNTPTEITRKVAFEGLASLSEEDFRYVPPVSEIRTDNQAYRAALQEVFAAHGAHGNSGAFENFFAAQVLWDETMAEKVADYHRENPQTQIVVLAGEGHVNYGYGIPDRVARRISEGSFMQRSVRLGQSSSEEGAAPTDFVWRP